MIRLSNSEDVPGLMELAVASHLFTAEHLGELQALLREHFAHENGGGFWLTYEQDKLVIGAAYCEPELMTNETWNLRLIAVYPGHEGEGRGRALLSNVEKRLRERGGRLLVVDTSATDRSERVRDFYRRSGYIESASVPEFFDIGEDKVTFTKKLRAA